MDDGASPADEPDDDRIIWSTGEAADRLKAAIDRQWADLGLDEESGE